MKKKKMKKRHRPCSKNDSSDGDDDVNSDYENYAESDTDHDEDDDFDDFEKEEIDASDGGKLFQEQGTKRYEKEWQDDRQEMGARRRGGRRMRANSKLEKSRSCVSIKVAIITLITLTVIYAGFIGGEKLMDWTQVETQRDSVTRQVKKMVELSDEEEEENELDDVDLNSLVHEYYKKHNPKLLPDVPMILARYAGNEKELFEKLEKKYNEPVLRKKGTKVQDEGREDLDKVEVEEDDGEEVENEEEEFGEEEGSENWSNRKDEEENEEKEGEEEEEEEVDVPFSENQIVAPDSSFDGNQEEQDIKDSSRGKVKMIILGFPGTLVQDISDFANRGLGLSVAPEDDTCSAMRQAMHSAGIPEFNRFDKYEVIASDCSGLFALEVAATYPTAKVVVLVEAVESWYRRFDGLRRQGGRDYLLRQEIYDEMLGTSGVDIIEKKQFERFYERVLNGIPRTRRKMVCLDCDQSWSVGSKSQWHWLATFMQMKMKPSWGDKKVRERETLRGGGLRPLLPEINLFSKVHLYNLGQSASQNGQLRVIGIGLGSTGGSALVLALRRLGYRVTELESKVQQQHGPMCTECKKALHSLMDVYSGKVSTPAFGFNGVFHNVDAVVGAASIPFLREMLLENPNAKVILTVRHLSKWLDTLHCRMQKQKHHVTSRGKMFENQVDPIIYGSKSSAYMLQKKYMELVTEVSNIVPADRLLVLDVEYAGPAGKAWKQVCNLVQASKCSSRLISANFPSISTCK